MPKCPRRPRRRRHSGGWHPLRRPATAAGTRAAPPEAAFAYLLRPQPCSRNAAEARAAAAPPPAEASGPSPSPRTPTGGRSVASAARHRRLARRPRCRPATSCSRSPPTPASRRSACAPAGADHGGACGRRSIARRLAQAAARQSVPRATAGQCAQGDPRRAKHTLCYRLLGTPLSARGCSARRVSSRMRGLASVRLRGASVPPLPASMGACKFEDEVQFERLTTKLRYS